MKTDYISRTGIIAEYDRRHQGPPGVARKIMETFPAADVVSREAFNRILADNDTMRAQLAQIGKRPGDSMEDLRLAVYTVKEALNNYGVDVTKL